MSANAFGDGERLAERAVAMARAAPEDPYAGLAPEEDLLKDAFPDLELLDTTSVAAEALVERARAAEAAACGGEQEPQGGSPLVSGPQLQWLQWGQQRCCYTQPVTSAGSSAGQCYCGYTVSWPGSLHCHHQNHSN